MSKTNLTRRGFLGTSLSLPLLGAATTLAADKQLSSDPASWQSNEKIQKARQAALEILAPTKKELEHGLKLHADSLVFDGYGFSPNAAIDGDALRKEIESRASAIEVADSREDMFMTRHATDDNEFAEYKQAWNASGVTCVFQNAGQECQDPHRLLKRLAHFTYVTDMRRDFVFKAATPADIEMAKRQNKHCLYFTGNAVPLVQRWDSVENELSGIRTFFELGIRMMHLTYNRRNVLADGCAEKANGGLSDFGRAAIAEMNRIGVIVDVAHTGWKSSFEAAKASKRPVVASHTVAQKLQNHIRSKPDEVIQAIIDSGGYVGICCIPAFLGGKGGIVEFIDHIDYVAKKFGTDHVSIGTDVNYSSRNSGPENKKVGKRPSGRKRWAQLWPKGSLSSTATLKQRFSLSWTNWPLFTVGLVQRGYSDKDIQKILGGNVLRVARAVLS